MATNLPTAIFPGKNTDPQSTEALVDPQRRVTPNWRRWMEFVDIAVRRTMAALNDVINGGTGFGFNTTGLFTDNEELGDGICDSDKDLTFPSATRSAKVTSDLPAASTAIMHVYPVAAGIEQPAVATINFAAAGTAGTVAWSPNPYTLPAGTKLRLRAPSPRDATLSGVTGFIPGDPA